MVWPTRPERNHLIVPIHASMMLHPYMFTLPSGIYMPYYHLLENTSFHSVEENISLRKHANPHAFLCVKMYHTLYCPLYAESTSNLYIQLIIADATPRMAFPYIRKNDGCHFCMETGFLCEAFSFEESISSDLSVMISGIG